jgi:hypothetical protein
MSQSPDLDEIRLNRFVVHNDKLRPFLRGEGVTVGKFFELTTWRREGLLARLRMRDFNVRTLEDRVAALPTLPTVEPLGPFGVRILSNAKERIATFDQQRLHWQEIEVEEYNGKSAVRVRDHEPVRRRKSRGRPEYFLVALTSKDQINLLPVDETRALLHAYAHIAQHRAAMIYFTKQTENYYIAQQQALLPPPHREILGMLVVDKAKAWTIMPEAFDLAQEVFVKLSLQLKPLEQHADAEELT